MMDLERSMRGILRGFGLRVGQVTRRSFEGRIRELVEGHSMLQTVMSAMLTACNLNARDYKAAQGHPQDRSRG
jgi:hypothetical protein